MPHWKSLLIALPIFAGSMSAFQAVTAPTCAADEKAGTRIMTADGESQLPNARVRITHVAMVAPAYSEHYHRIRACGVCEKNSL